MPLACIVTNRIQLGLVVGVESVDNKGANSRLARVDAAHAATVVVNPTVGRTSCITGTQLTWPRGSQYDASLK
jgi:hypothetical protein